MKNSAVICFLGVIFVEFLLLHAHGSDSLLYDHKQDGAVEAATDIQERRPETRRELAQKDFDIAGGAIERHDGGHGSPAGGKARGGGEQAVRPKDRSGANSHVLQQHLLHFGVGLLFLAASIF